MSNTVYYVSTVNKQYEIARLIDRLDQGVSSHETRLKEIASKTHSIPPLEPFKALDIPDNQEIRHLTRMIESIPRTSVFTENPSAFSQKLEESIRMQTIKPIFIQKEQQLSPNEKRNLGEVRIVTNQTVHDLLKGKKVGDAKLLGYRLLAQDGNVFDAEFTLPNEEGGVIRSKICVFPDGTFSIHQVGERAHGACEKVAKRLAATVDLALNEAYAKSFNIGKAIRAIEGEAIIGGKERLTISRSMCG